MAACFGLYFGSSNVSIAMHMEGTTDVLTNDAGDRVTPAMVVFINGEKIVGLAAKQNKVRFASSTIGHFKAAIRDPSSAAKRHKELKVHIVDEVNYQIIDGENVQNHSLSSLVISIFKHMHDIAKRCCQESDSVYPSVLSVPSSFSEEQKELIRSCAVKAGFNVLRVISEHSAAALAYKVGQDSNRNNSHMVVFRVGGSSMDVTVLEIAGGIYRTLSQVTVPDLGGETFTRCLVEHCLQEFHRQYKADVGQNQRAVSKLHNAADICKHGLTLNSTSQCCAESLYDGIDLSLSISRARFESLVGNVLQKCLDPIRQALEEAGLKEQDIQHVVLCGGSAKISRLQQLIRDYFEKAQVLTHIPPDEVIPVGAAEEAAILSSKEKRDIFEIETLAKTIFIKAKHEEKAVLIPALLEGSPIPARWQHSLDLPDNQTSFVLEIMEGNRKETCPTTACTLGKLVMNHLPENSGISISIQVKSDGSLYVCCQEAVSKKAASLIIEAGS